MDKNSRSQENSFKLYVYMLVTLSREDSFAREYLVSHEYLIVSSFNITDIVKM